MASKGVSLVFIAIVVIILVLFAGAIGAYLVSLGGKTLQKGERFAEQVGIKAKILPQQWYAVEVLSTDKGWIKFNVRDTNGTASKEDDVYVTDFDPTVGYKVFDNGVQTTVLGASAFPVAYVAAVVDSRSPKFSVAISNLTKIKFANTNVAVISVSDIPEKVEFKPQSEAVIPRGSSDSANYWGALAAAAKGKFNVVIVTALDSNETIREALSLDSEVRFYLLSSSCRNLNKFTNITLQGYLATRAERVTAKCYERADDLLNELISDVSPINLIYEPKFVSLVKQSRTILQLKL